MAIKKKNKILFVAETYSIHTAKWVNQLSNSNWEVHIFQSIAPGYGPEFQCGTIYFPSPVSCSVDTKCKVTIPYFTLLKGLSYLFPAVYRIVQRIHESYLAKLIVRLEPDIVHSLGLNVNWNNLLLPLFRTRRKLGRQFKAPWVYSSWGADLDLYATLSPANRSEVKRVLRYCDYHIPECERDAKLARKMGFQGETIEALPAFGGCTWLSNVELFKTTKTSRRKTIILKGRDSDGPEGDPQGRAMTAMKAFWICRELLKGYRIIIIPASISIRNEAAVLAATTDLTIKVLPNLPYSDWLRILSNARLLIALTVSDGLPGTLVEAMSLGAFPLHSNLEPIKEWIRNGENGLLVPPEDLQKVVNALKLALSDNELVDRASELNKNIVDHRLADSIIRPKVLEMYHKIAKKGHCKQY